MLCAVQSGFIHTKLVKPFMDLDLYTFGTTSRPVWFGSNELQGICLLCSVRVGYQQILWLESKNKPTQDFVVVDMRF